MNKEEPISTETDETVKPWRLPFWTQPPEWESEKESEEDTQGEEDIDAIEPPSAEELESIRREAYNDGLEQGLIEGRQKGQQEGKEQGFQQGLEEGKTSGHAQGYEQGMSQGEDAGKQSAIENMQPIAQHLNQLVDQLHTTILERDSQLPNTITLLVMSVCEQVLKHELKSGTASIHKFVQSALAQLPEGSEHIEVQTAQEDYDYLVQSLKDSPIDLKVKANPELSTGVCKVKSKHSLVEYSAYEHLQKILEPLAQQLLKAVDEEGAADASQILSDSIEPEPQEEEAALTQSHDSDMPITEVDDEQAQ